MTYSIEFYKDALKYLQKLDRTNRIRITQHLQILCEDPYHPELDIKRMQGTMDEYRLRVGSYRIIYSVENDKLLIQVIKIGSISANGAVCEVRVDELHGRYAGPWGPVFCFYRIRGGLCYTGDKRAEKLMTWGDIEWKRSIHRKS